MLKAEKASASVFSKIGLYGEAGSGKTTTALLISIGLHQFIGSKKPIAFMDTETGSDFAKVLCEKAKIDLNVYKYRSFEALLEIIPTSLQCSDILIIDSISHPYQDMMESYLKKTKKKRLAFQDWNVLKPAFRQFTDPYVREKLHITICGRSQGIWDYFKDDDGSMQLHQIGTKMKVEKEMGYEPNLLIEMEKVFRDNGKGWIHRATVLKDRNPDRETTLDGKSFDDPTFNDFLPHFKILNIGGEHKPVDIEDSQKLFDAENGTTEWAKEQKQKNIVIQEIGGLVDRKFPTPTAKSDKVARLALSQYVFSTTSKDAIEQKSLEELRDGRDKIVRILSVKDNIRLLRSEDPEEHFAELVIPELKEK